MSNESKNVDCPCGSGEAFTDCCGPFLDGSKVAGAPVDLMRARYSAYALGRVPFIVETHHPETRDEVDPEAVRVWSESAEWLGLEVVGTEGGQEGDEEGVVEFVARYVNERDTLCNHRERSVFRRRDGRWYFHSGEVQKAEPVVRDAPKVGRNDPCPCGSGRKHKKCCGRAA